MGPAGKENLAAEAPEAVRVTVATGPEEKEAQQAPEGSRAEVAVTPGPEEAVMEGKPEEGGTQQAPGGALGSAWGPRKEEAPAPVACVAGVPREPVSGREVARVTRPGGGTPPETLEQVNQQYLKSKYKFKEGAPLKDYLQQRVASFREPCTLVEVLTWLKEIIRDNPLFDERNPAMIVGDAPLEAALRNKKVHVNDIRSVVMQQLTMVEARQGPWNQALLLRGMARLESMSTPSRPEGQAVATPASVPRVRAIGLIPIPTGAVVLHSPNSGIPRNSGVEVPARSLRLDNSAPKLQHEIGVVSYTFPERSAAAQSGGGVTTANATSGEGFTGVRIRPLAHRPGVARAPLSVGKRRPASARLL
jgi:hypothetical protein